MIAAGPWVIWAGIVLFTIFLYLLSQFWFGAVAAALAVCGVLITYAFWFVPRSRRPRKVVDRGYVTDVASRGIVSLELAGTVHRAREIVKSWRDCSQDQSGRKRNVLAEVTAVTGADFGFVLAYLLVFACTTAWTANVLIDRSWGWSWLHGPGFLTGLGIAILAAAMADVVENLFMLRMIAGAIVTDRLPAWTRRLAILKFAVLALAAAYAGIGLAAAVL